MSSPLEERAGPRWVLVKKWGITLLAVLSLVALGFAARIWVPWVLEFAVKKKETIDSFGKLAEVVSKVVAWLAAAFVFVFKLWHHKDDEEPKPSQTLTVENSRDGRDMINAAGSVQTGGVSLPVQGNAPVAGDVVGGNKTTIFLTSAPAVTSTHQLPPPPADFKGRKDELDELREAVESGGVMILGLYGQGGVGKTVLALKLAERLAPNYPDVQIYIDLRGVSEKPLTPGEAMAHVIRAFHPEAKLPESRDELGGLYRSALHGKRALLLMDNARDAAQVKPLIPPRGCILLVTSRQHFALEGLHAKNLNTLPPPDARAFLLAVASRIDGEADAIARLCGCLPLALRLAATALVERVDIAPAEYARRLGDEKGRLRLLIGSDESVEASINLSYDLLDPETKRCWRVLAVFADTFDAAAAAALWEKESDSDVTQDLLSRLLHHSLLEWNETARRYRLHDLMRDFARVRLVSAEQVEAGRRHSRHYALVLHGSDTLYLKGGKSVKRALALFDVNWGNIQAGQRWASEHSKEDREAAKLCSSFPNAGAGCLSLRQHPLDRIRWGEAALSAALQLNDRIAESAHLDNLGTAYAAIGEFRRAIEHHEKSLEICRQTGNRQGEASALCNLASSYTPLGDARRSIPFYETALAIAREIGDRQGEGNVLGNMGSAHAALGEVRCTIECYEASLAIAREIGNRRSEGVTLSNLGNAYGRLGETGRAISCYGPALEIAREIGDREGEGNVLGNLGSAYAILGEARRSIEYCERSLAIACEIGNRRGEGNNLANLGTTYGVLGETERAIEYYKKLLAIARETGNRYQEGFALFSLGEAQDRLGEREKAVQYGEAAINILEEIENPMAEAVRELLDEWRRR